MVLNVTEKSNKGIDYWISNVDNTGQEKFWCLEGAKAWLKGVFRKNGGIGFRDMSIDNSLEEL